MLNSSLSQQHPDLPVLGSLLAGLLLPVHDDNTESRDDSASSTAASSLASRSCSPAWTSGHLLPITHGLRAGAGVAEICERLQELDEISKRHVDVLEHFVVIVSCLNRHGPFSPPAFHHHHPRVSERRKSKRTSGPL